MADPAARHADHDPMLVASLLDADLADAQRATAQARIDTCADCATLYADLLAVSVATRAQPAPPRQRDFRLTAADAARLRAEPSPAEPRQTGVMTEPSAASLHPTHDTILVASLADHSLPPSERSAAESLVSSCSECAALRADLLTLVAATRAMPTPPRRKDYSLTPEDAARLHGSRWRRLVAAIGSSRDSFSRPLAIGLSTLGLVGILIASAPTVIQLPGGSATSREGGQAAQPIANPALGTTNDTTGKAAPGAALPPHIRGCRRSRSVDRARSCGRQPGPCFRGDRPAEPGGLRAT